ncbi:MAG: SUMF1/EgtB/PvdO family nonheme iron enzyme [Chromatiaceae bacterium]|nr:SUMF1/EgtB/PvdO family nonheme iron enzyme [Chromatiaceae bacterium]
MIETAIGSNARLRYRYPGPSSFDDSPIGHRTFFGRDSEAGELADRIAAEQLTILYGKSGIGKTSLLNAGLFPRLRSLGFAPLLVRPREVTGSWLSAIAAAAQEMAERHNLKITAPQQPSHIGEYFAGLLLTQGDRFLLPVLVLDQFEEIFRLDPSSKDDFGATVGALLSGVPRLHHKTSGLRVVLSLREEFVGALEEFTHTLPGLLSSRYRLQSMTREGAQLAIVEPARLPGAEFASPVFKYGSDMLARLMDFLGNRGSFEPIQLQVICRYIEQEVLERSRRGESFSPVNHSDYFDDPASGFHHILATFYADTLSKIDNEIDLHRARELCEYGLVRPDGYRDSLSAERIEREYHVSAQTLDLLVDSRLLRREDRLNDLWYELTHDRLAEAIASRRRFRVPRTLWIYLVAAAIALAGVFAAFVVEVKRSAELRQQQALSDKRAQEIELRNAEIEARSSDIDVLRSRLLNATQAMTTELIERGGLILPKMVEIPAGVFLIAIPGGSPGAQTLREIRIPEPFRVSQYEITFKQYDQFANAVGKALPSDAGWGRSNRPVINIAWEDAVQYTVWLTQQARKNTPTAPAFRLLTEAQWEYAARSGVHAIANDDPDAKVLCQFANHADLSLGYHWVNQACSDGTGNNSAPVGTYHYNAFGLSDMQGNVAEWVADCWNDGYTNLPFDGSAALDGDCTRRVVRGGSWFDVASRVGTRQRDWHYRYFGNDTIGFRIAQDVVAAQAQE